MRDALGAETGDVELGGGLARLQGSGRDGGKEREGCGGGGLHDCGLCGLGVGTVV